MTEEGAEDVVSPAASNKGASKVSVQITKLRDANTKYKSLLKMAKERIEAQEEELETLRGNTKRMKEQIESERTEAAANPNFAMEDEQGEAAESSFTIVQVCQRVKVEAEGDTSQLGEIWALVEFENFNPDQPDAVPAKRYKKWRKFDTESELSDFIRRDTGEPLTLPPYSLSPEQSNQIQEEARQSVAQVTEEFRRFRVRAEVSRKQADAQIRDLHSSNVQTAKRRIEGQDLEKELEQARTDHAQLERLKAEMAEQEAQWKEAYDMILAENNALKSSGSEALLAAQWRQRYETCLSEKEDIETRLQMEVEKADAMADQRRKVDAGKYEMKYRDLKESFRLYRKKAKEIFEAQQRGDVALLNISDRGTEEAKLAYIRNLMVNYLSSDVAVREHMEGAIGTVLKFSEEDKAKIEKQKAESGNWF